MLSIVLFKAMQNYMFSSNFLFLISVFLSGVCLHHPELWSGLFFCMDRACIFIKRKSHQVPGSSDFAFCSLLKLEDFSWGKQNVSEKT